MDESQTHVRTQKSHNQHILQTIKLISYANHPPPSLNLSLAPTYRRLALSKPSCALLTSTFLLFNSSPAARNWRSATFLRCRACCCICVCICACTSSERERSNKSETGGRQTRGSGGRGEDVSIAGEKTGAAGGHGEDGVAKRDNSGVGESDDARVSGGVRMPAMSAASFSHIGVSGGVFAFLCMLAFLGAVSVSMAMSMLISISLSLSAHRCSLQIEYFLGVSVSPIPLSV